MNASPRLVSAAAFAAAAFLFGVIGIGATSTFDYGRMVVLKALLFGPPVMAMPAAVVGWFAGLRLARASESLEAATIGIAVTFGSVLLYAVVAGVGLFAMEALGGDESMIRNPSGIAVAFLFVVAYALAAGLIAAPFGALGAFLAWRWIRRDDGRAEARP